MLSLVAHDLCWITGTADDPMDQCAHGKVEMIVNGVSLVTPEDGVWTVSAAALYLLRTLSDEHTLDNSVAETNFLFPCCGFSVWLGGERYPVMCIGCNQGIDIGVRHKDAMVYLSVGEDQYVVSRSEWHVAVLSFTKQIEEFYARCAPKVEVDDLHDREGWVAFWNEWRERTASERG